MIDYIMKLTDKKCTCHGVIYRGRVADGTRSSSRAVIESVKHLEFADDIVICIDTAVDSQLYLSTVETIANSVGLYINHKKTEYIVLGGSPDDGIVLSVQAGPLVRVDQFRYLGALIADSVRDVNSRIGLAWTAAIGLDPIWRSGLDNPLKVSFFRSVVESVLLYGCETWSLTEALNTKLDGNYTRLLRYIQGIHWSQHITNEVVYNSLPKLSTTIRKRRLQFAGHCIRADNHVVSKLVLWEAAGAMRVGGGNITTYAKRILDDMNTVQRDKAYKHDDIIPLAMNRELWKTLCNRM
jgi:hypothetical protein